VRRFFILKENIIIQRTAGGECLTAHFVPLSAFRTSGIQKAELSDI
jgi:hypothetical protein